MATPISWWLIVLTPYVVLIACFILLRGGGTRTVFEKASDLGVDLCVLGLGIWTALVFGGETQHILGVNTAQVGVPVIAVAFLFIAFWERLSKSTTEPINKARISFMLGFLVFGANSALVAYVDYGKQLSSTIAWGLGTWLIPLVGVQLVLRGFPPPNGDLKAAQKVPHKKDPA
jgi:hypothetical protein